MLFVDSTDLLIYDVKDPASPKKLFSTTFPGEIRQFIYHTPDTFFFIDKHKVDTEEGFYTAHYSGSSAPTLLSSQKYFHDGQKLIFGKSSLYRINGNAFYYWNFPLVEEEPTPGALINGHFKTSITRDDYTYYLSTSKGLTIYKHSNQAEFTPIDTLDVKGNAVFEYKGLLFVGGEDTHLTIFDVSNPKNVVKKAYYPEQQNSFKNIFAVDSTQDHLYMVAQGTGSWVDVLNINMYLPTITYKKDTTHAIKKDTTNKKDTVIDVNSDSIVTTLKLLITTDSMFVKSTKIANSVPVDSTIDTTVTIAKDTLLHKVDTLHKSSLIHNSVNSIMLLKKETVQFTLPQPTSGEATLAVFDLRGQLLHREKLILTRASSVGWTKDATIAHGFYVATLSINGETFSKRFQVR